MAVALTATPASATDDQAEANDIADIIAEAAPSAERVAPATSSSRTEARFDRGATDVAVSTDAGKPVEIRSEGVDVTISLPEGLDVNDGVIARDGTVVFEESGDDAHAAVQTLDDGSVRLQTVLDSPDAPSTYTYDFGDDVALVLLDDGSVEVTEDLADGVTAVLGTIDAPWAVDAEGASVPTHYTVEGSGLTQHVAHSSEYAYPVTADPTISFGRYIYVRYSRSDVRFFTTGLNGAINDKAEFALILCGKIPHWAAKGGCMLVGKSYHSSIYNTFKTAKANNQCAELRLAYGSFLPVAWRRYSC